MDEADLVALALAEADRGLEAAVRRLVEAAGGHPNPNALVNAAARLAQTGRAVADEQERVAFANLTAAHRRIVDDRSSRPEQ